MYLTNWAREMLEQYKVGISNSFIITGNIGDYAYNTVNLYEYLFALLKEEFRFKTIYTYSPKSIKYSSEEKETNPEQVSGFSDLCMRMKRTDIRNAYIINYPNLFLPATVNNSMSQEEKNNLVEIHSTLTSCEYTNSSNMVIFICESVKDINKMLISSNIKTEIININLPDDKNRKYFINYLLKKYQEKNIVFNCDLTTDEIVRLTAGLTLVNIEDILLKGLNYNDGDTEVIKITKDIILDRKKELIRREHGEIIEFYDTDGFSLDKFAGQDKIKAYFQEVVIDAIKNNTTSIIPKGVLLMGPPGTGKTYFSRCLAGDAGINFVEFKMSKILDKWVGEAEKNLEKAFSVFRALYPVGVFIDELDQALSRGENDSNSVNKNLFGMFLSELSKPENRGKIIWIGATNYPNKIDEALKRSGRFDKKIPFFAPNEEERKAVFKIHLNKSKAIISEDISYDYLAQETDGYTQAEIENIVVKALELATRKSKQSDISKVEITFEDLETALEYMLSAQNNRIKEMEDIALEECNDLEFLPEKYIKRREELLNKEK